MGDVLDDLVDFVVDVWEGFVSVVETIWDELCMPILEGIFGLFGIEDETIVHVQKVSTPIFASNTEDVIQKAKIKAVLEFVRTEYSFFSRYLKHIGKAERDVKSYYRFGERGQYIHGLPTMEVSAKTSDNTLITNSLRDAIGTVDSVVLGSNSGYLADIYYFKYQLQESPTYNYLPHNNTLTFTDPYGIVRTDYTFDSVVFNAGANNYTINISRIAEEALFWIDGPTRVIEGNTIQFKIYCNRVVPTGESVTINFTYGGTATDGVDYTSVASIVMVASVDFVYVNITTIENVAADTARAFTITLDSITNTNGAFEAVGIHGNPTINVDIIDDDSLMLTMRDQWVDETIGTLPVSVVLEADATLYVDTTDTFNSGVDFISTDTQLTLSVTPEDDAYVYVEFDTIENTNWTRAGNVLTFGAAFGTTSQIVVQISTRRFTVDYSFTDVTTIGGTDYDNTPGTLNFTGNDGEVQIINIPITSDVAIDDKEQFQINLSNCSDVNIDISYVCTITIIDGTETPPAQGTVVLADTIIQPNYVKEPRLLVRYYTPPAPDTEWYYWLYTISTNVYPGIEPKSDRLSQLEILPIAILRRDRVNVDSDKTSEEYRTTKRLLQLIDLDIDDLIAAVMDSGNTQQTDLMIDAYVHFAANPTDSHQLVQKLVYNSFHELIVTQALLSNENEYSVTVQEQDVQNAIVWNEHTVTINAGVTGIVGWCSHVIDTIEYYPNTEDSEADMVTQSRIRLRKQINTTQYEQIEIRGLNGLAAINYGTYHNIAVNTVGDANFTIPVSMYMLDQFTKEEQLIMYQYLLRVDFYALEVVHLEWYETAGFWNLVEFVATALTLYSLGTASGPIEFFKRLLWNALARELVVFIVEEFGSPELAAVVMVVMAIVASEAGFLPMQDFATAEGLLNLTTNFADNLATGYGVAGEQLAEDLRELTNMAEERLEEIRELVPEQPVDRYFLARLQSADTTKFVANNLQFEFDQLYSYDNLISNYHSNILQLGVV